MLRKHLATAVLLQCIDVLAMTDPTDASMQARLMRLAHDEREISASLRGNAMLPPQMLGQQVQSEFLAGQRSPTTAVLMNTAISPPIGTAGQQQQSTVSLVEATAAPPTKAASGSEGCEPACKKDQGICVNNFCLCHSPWSGESCEDAEAVEDGIPFEKDAQRQAENVSPEIGEAMKEKVAMPLAIFIWTSLLVLTFFCTAFCPQFCCRRSSGGPDAVAEYNGDFDKAETQFDIVEAWTFDSRKRHDREGQNEAQRREWFEENVGPKLQQIKWPHVHR